MNNLLKRILVNRITRPYVRKYEFRRHFKNELALINRRLRPKSNDLPVIHYSFKKAGSQYVKKILTYAAEQSGRIPVSLPGYAYRTHFPYLHDLSPDEFRKYEYLFAQSGVVHSVFVEPILNLANAADFKTLLMVRDPRDMMVSLYFSVVHSHPVADIDKYKQDRAKRFHSYLKGDDIDHFVLNAYPYYLNIYENFCAMLDRFETKQENLLVTKYEHMVEDFEGWLRQLLDHCEIELRPEHFGYLVDNYLANRRKKEDITKHHRKGTAGDHLEKLKPDSIDALNKIFSAYLEKFDYKV